MEKQESSIDLEGWAKYGKMATQLSPALLLYLGAQVLVQLKDIDPQHTKYFLIAGVVLTLAWMIYDRMLDRSDSRISLDLHKNLDPIDRDTQARIYDGLQTIGVIDYTNLNREQLHDADAVHHLLQKSLVSSVLKNHYVHDLLESDPDVYIQKKVDIVLRAFSGRNAPYRKLAELLLPDGICFEYAVEAAVLRWLCHDICPAQIQACEKKIRYYAALLKRTDISHSYKKRYVQRWLQNNKRYISLLDSLRNRSDILTKQAYPFSGISSAETEQASGCPSL